MNLPAARSEPYRPKARMRSAIKACCKSLISRLPVLGSLILRSYRMAKFLVNRGRWRWFALTDPSLRIIKTLGIQVNEIFCLQPDQIAYIALREFSLNDFKGRIVGGNWDDLVKKFEDLDIYVAIHQVCIKGRNWKETTFYKRFVQQVSNGHFLWGCRNLDDIDRRCAYIQKLYASIRNEGYKSQSQLNGELERNKALDDEVAVCIGRQGDFLFSDGAHRLAAAKLLGLDKIPVKVSVRHPEWVALRRDLLLYAREQGGKLYQPALHPDLENIPAWQSCEVRFRLICSHMLTKHGNLLDIGANIGYFCQRFEDKGFDCFAVENSLRELYFLRKLKVACKKNFEIISEDVLKCQKVRETNWNVVLALNVFHHFLKTKESFDLLIDLLRNLHADELFVEPCRADEPQMRGAYRNLGEKDFIRFIQDAVSLKNADYIGAAASDGIKLYRLS